MVQKFSSYFIPNNITNLTKHETRILYSYERIATKNESMLVEIGKRAFSGFTKLKSVDLSNSERLILIGECCFEFCCSLSYVKLPKNVVELPRFAFLSCVSLTKVIYSKSCKITLFNDYCFKHCVAINDIIIPVELAVMRMSCFFNCTNLTNFRIFSSRFSFVDNILMTPESICYCSPKFSNTSYSVPEHIEYILDGAFFGSKIRHLFLPNESVNSWGTDTFCTSDIENISVAKPLDQFFINPQCFAFCQRLIIMDLRILGNITTIEAGAFVNCTNLKELYLPKYIRSIAYSCFKDCCQLSKLHIPMDCTLVNIYPSAFQNTSLSEIYITKYVSYIGSLAFYLTHIKQFDIDPENTVFKFVNSTLYDQSANSIISYISNNDVGIKQYNKDELSSEYQYLLDISKNKTFRTYITSWKVNQYRDHCFFGASNIDEIIIPNGVTSIMYKSISTTSIIRLKLPDSIKLLGEECFSYNYYLKYVEFGTGISAIPKKCFEYCIALEYIKIPIVKIIRQGAFDRCYNVNCVYSSMPTTMLKKAFPKRVIYS